MRKNTLAIAWIDYKKAYDMVPQSWIAECLAMAGVSEQIKHGLIIRRHMIWFHTHGLQSVLLWLGSVNKSSISCLKV